MTTTQLLEKQLKDWKTKYANFAFAKEAEVEALNQEICLLKKELVRKDKQIESLYHMIQKIDAKVDELTDQVSELTKENTLLKETIILQNEQIVALKSRINKDSDNSSKPSSTNFFKKPIQNNREKTGRKPGGQIGHKGSSLKQFNDPTEIIEKSKSHCNCGGEIKYGKDYLAKQLVDIDVRMNIIEERIRNGVCIICGKKHAGTFSEEFKNPVQYGNNIKSLITLLNNHACVSINKTTEILNSITDNQLNIADSTVVNIQNALSSNLDITVQSIKRQLIECEVLHADETGCRVNGKVDWIQVFCNKKFTLCGHNEKRGSVAIEDMDILKYFIGILVHDHFSSYYKDNLFTHSECNAHILRYLKNIIETFKHGWAREMIDLLTTILQMKKEHVALGKSSFTTEELTKLSNAYDNILANGQAEYENSILGKKHIKYYNDERLLLKRLLEFKDEHLLFATNFVAPFDNNQAERDIRPFKTKMKVSGCFRSKTSIKSFVKIYSVISTLKKHEMNIYKNIRNVFNGKDLVFS